MIGFVKGGKRKRAAVEKKGKITHFHTGGN